MAVLVPGGRRSQEVDYSLSPGIGNNRNICLRHGALGYSYCVCQSVSETEQLSDASFSNMALGH